MIVISVIIPSRNRAATLYDTLESILKQTLDQDLFEVIICDNNSTDATDKIARSFTDKFKYFKYIKTTEPGLHIGRNKGFEEAKGEILVYADDDIEAFPSWLETIHNVFKDPKVMLVGGKNLPKWEFDPPEWIFKLWEKNEDGDRILPYYSVIDLGEDVKPISPHLVWGCNFSVRKEIIKATKGFHPDGMPQEIIKYRGDGETAISDYINAKGYKTIYHPCASVYHLVPKQRLSVKYLKRWSFNAHVGASYTDFRAGRDMSVSWLTALKKYFLLHFHGQSLQAEIYFSGVKGYLYHRRKIKMEPAMKEWVLKDNYL